MIKTVLKILLLISSIYILFWVVLLTVMFFSTNYLRKNMMCCESIEYYNKIKEIYKNKKTEIDLSKIFDFQWGKAYILPIGWRNDEEIDESIFNYCNVAPIDRDVSMGMIVFVNEEECVYKFIYDYRYLTISPLNEIVYNDNSLFTIRKNGKKYELSKE